MGVYILRRLLLVVPTFVLVTMIVFLSVRLMPGDVIDIMMDQMEVGGTLDRAAIEHKLGLDVPIHIQYGRWVSKLLQGDLGNSLWRGMPITEEIIQRLPVTLEIGLLALLTAQLIALPVGMYSAIRQDTVRDYVARSFAIACIAIPSFWLGTLVMVFPGIWWNWSPSIEWIPIIEDPLGNLAMCIIPSVILGMVMSGTTMRMTRTMMLETLRQDYVRTAWAKGLAERIVIVRHALRNALIPVVTIVGLQLPVLVGGSVIMEQIFCLPGVGRYLLEALNKRDYTIVSGVNLVMASFVLVVNLTIDVTYSFLDPRIRYK